MGTQPADSAGKDDDVVLVESGTEHPPYTSLAEFARDVLQIPANAFRFNLPKYPVVAFSAHLRLTAVQALRQAAARLRLDEDDYVPPCASVGGKPVFASDATSLRSVLIWPMPRNWIEDKGARR